MSPKTLLASPKLGRAVIISLLAFIVFLLCVQSMTGTELTSIPSMIFDESFNVFKSKAINNTVVVVPVNTAMLNWADNLLCSLGPTGFDTSQIVFWTLDEGAQTALQRRGYATYYDSSLFATSANENLAGFTRNYKRMMKERPKFFIKLLSAGFDVLMLDADTVFWRSPLDLCSVDAPCRGWIWGLSEYKCRFQSTLSNYQTTRKYGGNFIILPHDIWGTDHANSSTVWPGDGGSFADYDKFLTQLLSDIKANSMQATLVFDIWNEADGGFWVRSQQQWIDTYIRTHKRIRSDSGLNPMQITGPSHASQPDPGNTWWTNWMTQIKGNKTIPDQYSWHIEGDINNPIDDLQTNNATFASMLRNAGMAQPKIVNINEYGVFNEQVASGAAWWISRLERYDAVGLRGNWLSGYELHDLMAGLVSKPGAGTSSYSYTSTGYYPNGEWQVYKYYNTNMTGVRAQTTGTGDRIMDVYATMATDKVRVLTGVRLQTGTWYITINKLSAVGLPTSGSLNIHTRGFVDNGHYGEVDAPTDRGYYSHQYSGDTVTFPVYQTSQDEYTAWGFEFAV